MTDDKHDESQRKLHSCPSLLMRVQTASKDWDVAPEELNELRGFLLKADYDIDWSPKRFGINLLTPNKIRAIVLKRMITILYPFESFWITETLDETLQKCLLVCQQLTIQTERATVWGQCSMQENYLFWKKVLEKVVGILDASRSEEGRIQHAKSTVISALIDSRGTDWDKQIASNFEEGLGSNRFPIFLKSRKSAATLAQVRPMPSPNDTENAKMPTASHPRRCDMGTSEIKVITTTFLSSALLKETQSMLDILKTIENSFREDCILRIENAFLLGKRVTALAVEFEGYMTANNRSAFKDVDSLANHTDKVIRSMARLAAAYNEFFLEFQKYFAGAGGRGDELGLSTLISKLAEYPTVVE